MQLRYTNEQETKTGRGALPKQITLKNYQFRYVYNKGKSVANRYLVLYMIQNGQEYNRLGISVSKKVGNSVVRSRVTRLVRESYRLLLKNSFFKQGYDIVFIARMTAKDAPFADINKSVVYLARKSGVADMTSLQGQA